MYDTGRWWRAATIRGGGGAQASKRGDPRLPYLCLSGDYPSRSAPLSLPSGCCLAKPQAALSRSIPHNSAPHPPPLQGAALAAKLEDPQAALEHLLGPSLKVLGSGEALLSEQVKAVTEHK